MKQKSSNFLLALKGHAFGVMIDDANNRLAAMRLQRYLTCFLNKKYQTNVPRRTANDYRLFHRNSFWAAVSRIRRGEIAYVDLVVLPRQEGLRAQPALVQNDANELIMATKLGHLQ